MFFTSFFVGYCSLAFLGQDFRSLIINVAQADGDIIIYDVHQEQKTWEEASDDCQGRGEALAYFLTYDEHKALRKYIREQNLEPRDSTSGYWLGAKYRNGRWKWDMTGTDTREEPYFMAGWHWGEPNRRERNGDKQGCMELKYIQGSIYTESMSWNDMWCDEKRGFICQSFGHRNST